MKQNKQRGYLPDMTSFFILLILAGFLLGIGVAYAVPAAWNFVKPYIHELTK